MIPDLPTGRALHRFRRLNGVKQGHVAELLGVSQGSVSRWESGAHELEIHHRDRICAMIAARANNDADAALRWLVCNSAMAVHLVCDATHRLLAASPSRVASWAARADDYIGRSLWPFASPEIMSALPASGLAILLIRRGRLSTGRLLTIAGPALVGTAVLVPLALGRSSDFATTSILVVLAVLLSGLVSPFIFARLPILASAESPHDSRIATANGLLTQFGAGGALIGPPLGGLIADGWGWIALGYVIAGLALPMLAGVALSEWITARSSRVNV